MILLVINVSHLFLVFNVVISGLPIVNNRSDIANKIGKFADLPLSLSKLEALKNFNLTQVIKDLKDFGFDNLKDDHHLEGLPLDRNGKVNRDFHKEIFLGNHELFESDILHNEGKRNRKLEEIFNEADVDHDKRLTKDELVNHLFRNIQQHLKEAKDRNSQLFLLIDTDQDGKITWHEYFSLYIKFHHMNTSSLTDVIQQSYDDNLRKELLKIRSRWNDTDGDGDNQLDTDGFLAFRHPEIATRSYRYIVDDIITQMDRNNDQKLTLAEFVFLPSGTLEDPQNKEWIEMHKTWVQEQGKEFRQIDENGDKLLSRDELLKVYNPLNREHINKEIKGIFPKIDDSPKDDALSLDEIKKHGDVFTGL